MYSNIEPVVYGVAVWLATYIPTYLTAANAEIAPWPSNMTFPSIFLTPDNLYNPPALKRAAVNSTIPSTGPFPYLMVNLDNVDVEWAGQNSENLTLHLSIVLAMSEQKETKLLAGLLRYADAIVQAVGHNVTLGGLVEEAKISSVDKQELPDSKAGFLVVDMTAKMEIVCE